MNRKTHCAIDERLCGEVTELSPGRCCVRLQLTEAMRADERGLAHGGFIFGAADYAAMLAVNEPYVVLGAAEVRFKRPSSVGEVLTFEAQVEGGAAGRPAVRVVGKSTDGQVAFMGTFSCAVLAQHVLGAAPPPSGF
ncbi:MAG: PaaI family thioesterase [Rubrivivax sp.]